MQELWQPVPDAPGYEASNLGRIRSKHQVLNPFQDGDYLYAKVGGRKQTVHGVIARTWLGPRPAGAVVRHGAQGPLVNSVQNLCYGSQSENMQDMHRDGTYRIGDSAARRVLNSDQVTAIYQSTETSPVLAERHGVEQSTIRAIWRGKNWRSVTQHLPARLAQHQPTLPSA